MALTSSGVVGGGTRPRIAHATLVACLRTIVDDLEALIARARDVAGRAYAPYSHFRVGASVRDAQGAVFVGCNVESVSYGLTICAERNAIFAAVAAGARRPFSAMAVACLDLSGECMPCGACRQVMQEHLTEDAPVFVGSETFTVAQLLPYAFKMDPTPP
jgi:cytidine deaminase